MNKLMKAHWFDFLSQGHNAQNDPNEPREFSINGVVFELTFSTKGWFSLYRIVSSEFEGNVFHSKVMFSSDFYTLGRKCIHDMADDGVNHLGDMGAWN